MRRALILAVGLILLATRSRAGDFSGGSKLEIHAAPSAVNAASHLASGGDGQNARQSQPHRQYVISPTDSFPGSYYVETGHYYFQPHSGPRTVIGQGSFARIDDLAQRLEYEAGMACRDMNDNYRQNPGYAKTYKEAYHLYELAHELNATAHEPDRTTVTEKVNELNPLLESVRKDTSGWSRHQHEQHGQGGLQSKLERMEAVSHHLSNDVEPSTATHQTANADSADRSLLVK